MYQRANLIIRIPFQEFIGFAKFKFFEFFSQNAQGLCNGICYGYGDGTCDQKQEDIGIQDRTEKIQNVG
jgi:hypothetical protein